MSDGKNVSISFRVSARFKRLLEASAAREHRSQTNMLETLLFAHCERHGIASAQASPDARDASAKDAR